MHSFALLLATGIANWTLVGLPISAALASIALIGFIFGKRTRTSLAERDERRQSELDRAAHVAWQLESIADGLRHDLIAHHSKVASFKRRLLPAQDLGQDKLSESLCHEAEEMLGSTMQLAQQISHAYHQIRHQSEALETLTHGRTDPLTGVGNGRSLEQQLQVLLAGVARGNAEFAIALVSPVATKAAKKPPTRSHDGQVADMSLPQTVKDSDTFLIALADAIRRSVRSDADFVARLGDEFVIVMPRTSLFGASVVGDRLRDRVAEELEAMVSCGIAVAQHDDDSKSLLARADSALYSAKAAGANRMFLHNGTHIREHHPGSLRMPAAAENMAAHAAAVRSNSPFQADEISELEESAQILAFPAAR
jgi:GGDEF domain-containing protein